MLQALLALSLIIAFMPILVRKISGNETAAQMNATATQINAATDAAAEFVRDRLNTLPTGVTIYRDANLTDALEPYGLPLGFNPTTPFKQAIAMVIVRNSADTAAFISVSNGKMTLSQSAELAVRIGFWAAQYDARDRVLLGATGGWQLPISDWTPNAKSIYVRVQSAPEFSELVQRNPATVADNKFHTDLVIGGHDIRGIKDLAARAGDFKSATLSALDLTGTEDGKKMRNKFGAFNASTAVFAAGAGAGALNVAKGTLSVTTLSAPTLSLYGDPANLTTDSLSVYSFAMNAGKTGFNGPANWAIKQNAIFENVTLNIERMDVSGFINAARGQDVYVNDANLSYSMRSGIDAGVVYATNLTLRDQTSSALLGGMTGAVLVDIRPAGNSVLPDATVAGINNDAMMIPAAIDDDSGNTVTCKSIIGNLYGNMTYNAQSLTQNIICRYVFWQRLERRIIMKQCMLAGKSGC
ncbi:MAG: shufflon system plasmid conjugative transfer pilus tip adhesin PilV [Proteobacteria bacterium]|nr:shufflon system plasmid conjugative transfer pilus tip adhesin PilV [Pseudomonadota bacterium]